MTKPGTLLSCSALKGKAKSEMTHLLCNNEYWSRTLAASLLADTALEMYCKYIDLHKCNSQIAEIHDNVDPHGEMTEADQEIVKELEKKVTAHQSFIDRHERNSLLHQMSDELVANGGHIGCLHLWMVRVPPLCFGSSLP